MTEPLMEIVKKTPAAVVSGVGCTGITGVVLGVGLLVNNNISTQNDKFSDLKTQNAVMVEKFDGLQTQLNDIKAATGDRWTGHQQEAFAKARDERDAGQDKRIDRNELRIDRVEDKLAEVLKGRLP